MTTAEIKDMPVKDRILLMEEVWDTLIHEKEELQSPSWHGEILSKRAEKIKDGTGKFINIEDLKTAKNEY